MELELAPYWVLTKLSIAGSDVNLKFRLHIWWKPTKMDNMLLESQSKSLSYSVKCALTEMGISKSIVKKGI